MADTPVIKWSGSKRSQAGRITQEFPSSIDTYYEPFCGGCSVALSMMRAGRDVRRYVLSDANGDLVALLREIKTRPSDIGRYYAMLWEAMRKIDSQVGKREFYEKVRERFNDGHDPMDFFFLNRTCFNGLVRYNAEGGFNSSFHLNRDGIAPDKAGRVLHECSDLLNATGAEILHCSYGDIHPSSGDFVYADPPYADTKGMYGGGFSQGAFFTFLRGLPCGYAFSYNGVRGEDDRTADIPADLYSRHIYVKSGNSSFKRIKTAEKDAVVYESLYLRVEL